MAFLYPICSIYFQEMASAGRMCCRLIERNNRTRHPFTYRFRNTAKDNNQRWYSSATQKENEVELSQPRKNFDAVQKNIAEQVNHLYGSWQQVKGLASYDVPLHNFWMGNVTRPNMNIAVKTWIPTGQTCSLFQDVHAHKRGPYVTALLHSDLPWHIIFEAVK